jgi:glucose/arabinose dehydrogenase
MAFTPDGATLFTEKCQGLSVRSADGSIRLFGAGGAAVAATDFFCEGQSGAHGVAVDPMFSSNRTIYLFMPSSLTSPKTNRVVRLLVEPGYTTVSGRTDIVTTSPTRTWRRASAMWVRTAADAFASGPMASCTSPPVTIITRRCLRI